MSRKLDPRLQLIFLGVRLPEHPDQAYCVTPWSVVRSIGPENLTYAKVQVVNRTMESRIGTCATVIESGDPDFSRILEAHKRGLETLTYKPSTTPSSYTNIQS